MDIVKGSIVRVKVSSDSIHYGEQGLVMRTDATGNTEGPIRVWFGKERDHCMDHRPRMRMKKFGDGIEPPAEDNEHDPRIFNYNVTDLDKEAEWSIATLAARHWKDFHHSAYEPRAPFKPGVPCQVKDCSDNAVRRIIVNIVGTVCPADVCEAHAKKYHLCRMDDFPWKKIIEARFVAA